MTSIDVRLGTLGDVDDAASVYERSNLARRQGHWPSRPARVAQVTASLHDAAGHDVSWFLIGRDGTEAVAMALVHPFRADGGSGNVIPGTWCQATPFFITRIASQKNLTQRNVG